MTSPKALVLRTAGINCDAETVRALEGAGAPTDLFHLSKMIAEPGRFDDYGILVIPGLRLTEGLPDEQVRSSTLGGRINAANKYMNFY